MPEHELHMSELHYFSKLSLEFIMYFKSGMECKAESGILNVLPGGGVAVLVCELIASFFKFCFDTNGRTVSTRLDTPQLKQLFCGCYFPHYVHSSAYANDSSNEHIDLFAAGCTDFQLRVLGNLKFDAAAAVLVLL
jgi:hypothetical protein